MQAKKWVLLIALVIAGISCNAGQTKSEVLIKNDGGGDIPQYIAKYLYLQLSGEWVVIDGDCRAQNAICAGWAYDGGACRTINTVLMRFCRPDPSTGYWALKPIYRERPDSVRRN